MPDLSETFDSTGSFRDAISRERYRNCLASNRRKTGGTLMTHGVHTRSLWFAGVVIRPTPSRLDPRDARKKVRPERVLTLPRSWYGQGSDGRDGVCLSLRRGPAAEKYQLDAVVFRESVRHANTRRPGRCDEGGDVQGDCQRIFTALTRTAAWAASMARPQRQTQFGASIDSSSSRRRPRGGLSMKPAFSSLPARRPRLIDFRCLLE